VKSVRARPRTKASVILILALAFALPLLPSSPFTLLPPALSQPQPATLHQWGAVTLFHGLPSDMVRAIAQDSEGVMWFGTDAGLARYDGRRTQTVTDEGLAGRRVLAVRVGPGGELWVGTDAGAFVRAGGDGAQFRALPETKGKAVTALNTPAPGRALLATGDGLVFDCRKNPSDDSFAARPLLAETVTAAGKSQPLWLTSLAFAGETLLVGTRGRGLLAVTPEGTLKEVAGRPRVFFVESLAEDAQGGGVRLGAQTSAGDSGLYKIEGGAQPQQLRTSKLSGAETGTVSALARAGAGDLYAATDGHGVFRYRGEQVSERFTFEGTAGGLRSDRVSAVFVDREGVVWFGTNRGVCRFDPHGVRVEKLSEDTESNFVRSLYRTRTGRLLVGTNRGLFVRDERARAWREVEEVAGKTVYALAEDPRGNLLVGTAGGLYVGLQATGARPPDAPVRLAPEGGEPEEKSPGTNGGEGGEASRTADDRARAQANDETKEKTGEAGDKTGGGPKGQASEKSKGKANEKASEKAGEKADDKGGEKTDGAAVVKKSAEPAATGNVRAIAVLGGAVYVASFGRGVERFDGPSRRTLVWPKGADDARGREVVSLFAEESAGRLWIGTANAGVFSFDGRETTSHPALAPFGATTVWGIGGADSLLWLATSRGLYAFEPSSARVTEIAPGVDARAVHAVRQAQKEGGPRPAPQAWCATAGGGVLKVALDEQFGPVKTRLDAEQGLPTENAFAVLPLDAGEGEGPSVFVGTTRGLARYDPSAAAPLLKLTRITASRTHQPEELRDAQPLRLEYPQNSLVLDVGAQASRTFPEQFQYAFLLRDARGRAIKRKLSHDSQFQVEALPAGRYRVEARAYTLDLLPSEPLAFEFEVARAPFPRTIVLLSVLLAVALVVLLWTYLQHRRIRRSREELRDANRQLADARLQLANEAESERRRIARDLHDQTLADLRRLLLLTDEMQEAGTAAPASTASAPAASALGVANAGGVAPKGAGDAKGAGGERPDSNGGGVGRDAGGEAGAVGPAMLRSEIESISQEVRRICEDLSPSVLENVGFAAALEWSLASALAHLPSDCKFAYEFECDEDLEERLRLTPGVQMQVYRIVQEAVSNVCRHARATRVRLRVGVSDGGDFHLTLEDDGQGFDAGNRKARKGRGLAGIRGRASIIDAEVSWRPQPAEEGTGTVFTLRKPRAAEPADKVSE
jgi:signal transduction histidine kinase